MFVSGDLQFGGAGTVRTSTATALRLRPPDVNLGPTGPPYARVVYQIAQSFSSMKLSTTGDVIGTFLQDRATAIAGQLGPGPHMVPVTLTLESDRGRVATPTSGWSTTQMFTPLRPTRFTTLGSRAAVWRRHVQCARHGHAETARGHRFDNLSGDSPSVGRRMRCSDHGAMGNVTKGRGRGLDVTISRRSSRDSDLSECGRRSPSARGRGTPQGPVRTYRGDEIVHAAHQFGQRGGPLSLMVSDGSRMAQFEQRRRAQAQRAASRR
jgi:hypothetical protein